MSNYFDEWSKDKKQYSFPGPAQIYADLQNRDGYKEYNPNVCFEATKAYWEKLSRDFRRLLSSNIEEIVGNELESRK